ncbi:MAG: hypothetical protein P4L61_00540 [Candidatus Pacebacteria bacterium]|nr:hypothetical protein [Candidatus Paceibacterota bacterium]
MYHALLPQKAVKSLKTEYHVRFFIVLLFFISIAILAAGVFLVPSYLISSLAEASAAATAQSVERSIATDTPSIMNTLSLAGSTVTAISSSMSPSLSPIILRIASLKPLGISITSFQTSYDSGTQAAVSIEGKADTRNDLVTFQKIVEGDQDFSNVEVPISDLAPASHIQFSMQMEAAVQSSDQTQ